MKGMKIHTFLKNDNFTAKKKFFPSWKRAKNDSKMFTG